MHFSDIEHNIRTELLSFWAKLPERVATRWVQCFPLPRIHTSQMLLNLVTGLIQHHQHLTDLSRSDSYKEQATFCDFMPSRSPMTNKTLKTAEPTIVPKPTSFCAFLRHPSAVRFECWNYSTNSCKMVRTSDNSRSNYWCKELRCRSSCCHPCRLQNGKKSNQYNANGFAAITCNYNQL